MTRTSGLGWLAAATGVAAAAIGLTGTSLSGAIDELSWVPLDHPAIQYWSDTNDAVARLQKKLDSGAAKLEWANDGRGYLASLLKNLDINQDSQMLVFSKTSFQATKISPYSPRAIYFNDTTSVGFVQNSDVLEMVALDPKQGDIFYTLDNHKAPDPGVLAARCLRPVSRQPGDPRCSGYSHQFGLPRFKRHAESEGRRRGHRCAQPNRSALGRLVRYRQQRNHAPYGQRGGARSKMAAEPRP